MAQGRLDVAEQHAPWLGGRAGGVRSAALSVYGRGAGSLSGTTEVWSLPVGLLDRITVDHAVRFGKPCVRGTRITVRDVLGYLAGGMSEAQILEGFPQLSHEDILACVAYTVEREQRTSAPAS